LKLRVEAEVRATEDKTKVEAAIKKIFPTLQLNFTDNCLVGESTDTRALDRLHQLLRLRGILDSARKVMRTNRRENLVQFMLNKQVAAVSKVSFTDGESPLGPIVVAIEASDIERLIDYLAPRTREGKPIEEIRY
jgi:predicted RNA binding protein with dsRBD fold (UPF0201 family)